MSLRYTFTVRGDTIGVTIPRAYKANTTNNGRAQRLAIARWNDLRIDRYDRAKRKDIDGHFAVTVLKG